MKPEQRAVLSLVGNCIGYNNISFPASVDLDKVFDLACQQGVTCLCSDGLERIVQRGMSSEVPLDFVLQFHAQKQAIIHKMQAKREQACEFAQKLQPLRCTVLKGLDYSQYWPNPLYREYGDLDCWYGIDKIEKADALAEKAGACVQYGTQKHSHVNYKGLIVEGHRRLTDYDGSKIGDITERRLLELLEESASTPLMDTPLFSPNPLFTACFMLKHAQRHFMTEGIELRHFLDWMFFIDKAGDKIEWERLNSLLEEMKLLNFADMMTAYCVTRIGWEPKHLIANHHPSVINPSLLDKIDDFVFSKKADVQDKHLIYRARRILRRFIRGWRFRKLNYLPYHKAVWTWIAYASCFDRKPSKGLS